ncbi:MAG: hypothetical protein J0L80_08250 [Chitinophagales bacterium]|nr:hypothetical protein [Chitinophagales bacterium]
MKKLLFSSKLLLVGAMLVLPIAASAHSNWCNSRCGGGCNCGYNPYCAPLDGGLSYLAIAGVGYGIRRYRKNKQKNAEN